jgi:hypothetical protein
LSALGRHTPLRRSVAAPNGFAKHCHAGWAAGRTGIYSVMMLDINIITLYVYVLAIIFMNLNEVSKSIMI